MKLEIYRTVKEELNLNKIRACGYVECVRPKTAVRRLRKAIEATKKMDEAEKAKVLEWLEDEETFMETLYGLGNGTHADAGKDDNYSWTIELEEVASRYYYISVSVTLENEEQEEGEEVETPSTETVETVDEINNGWLDYDKSVARAHLENFGKIYLDKYGKPIDDLQYVEQELYNNDNDIEEYEINNKYQVEALRLKNGNEIVESWVIEELNTYKDASEDAKKYAIGEYGHCKLMGYDAVVVNAYDKEYDMWEEVESYKIE